MVNNYWKFSLVIEIQSYKIWQIISNWFGAKENIVSCVLWFQFWYATNHVIYWTSAFYVFVVFQNPHNHTVLHKYTLNQILLKIFAYNDRYLTFKNSYVIVLVKENKQLSNLVYRLSRVTLASTPATDSAHITSSQSYNQARATS